jgi:hypothetical protein
VTKERFRAIAIAVYGHSHWARDVARDLGVHYSSVWRWFKTDTVPPAMALAIERIGEKHGKSEKDYSPG